MPPLKEAPATGERFTSVCLSLYIYSPAARSDLCHKMTTIVFTTSTVRLKAEWLLSQDEVQVFVDQILLGMALFCSARGRTKEFLFLLRKAQSRLENGAGSQTGPYATPILAVAEVAFYPEYYYLRFLMDWFSVFELPLPRNIEQGWLALRAAPPGEVASTWQVLAATFYGWSFDPSAAVARLEELAQAYRRRRDRWSLALALQNIGRILEHQDYVDRHAHLADQADTAVEDALREAATLFQEVGDELEMAHTLRLLGTVVTRRDPIEALALAHRARDTFQQVGDRVTAAHMLWQLALIHLEHGEIEDGFKAFGQMRQAFEDLGNRKFTGYSLSLESIERVRFGDIDVARRLRRRSLAIGEAANHPWMTAYAHCGLGRSARHLGRYDEAITSALAETQMP